jgi:hypothetical protein
MSLTDVLVVAQYLTDCPFSFRLKADILDKKRHRNTEDVDDDEEMDPPSKDDDTGSQHDEEMDPPPKNDSTGSQPSDDEASSDKGELEDEVARKEAKDGKVPKKPPAAQTRSQTNPAQTCRKSQRHRKQPKRADDTPLRKRKATGPMAGSKVCSRLLNAIILLTHYFFISDESINSGMIISIYMHVDLIYLV